MLNNRFNANIKEDSDISESSFILGETLLENEYLIELRDLIAKSKIISYNLLKEERGKIKTKSTDTVSERLVQLNILDKTLSDAQIAIIHLYELLLKKEDPE